MDGALYMCAKHALTRTTGNLYTHHIPHRRPNAHTVRSAEQSVFYFWAARTGPPFHPGKLCTCSKPTPDTGTVGTHACALLQPCSNTVESWCRRTSVTHDLHASMCPFKHTALGGFGTFCRTAHAKSEENDFGDYYVVHEAITMGDLEVVQDIIASGEFNLMSCDKKGMTPLMLAVTMSDINLVRILLQLDDVRRSIDVVNTEGGGMPTWVRSGVYMPTAMHYLLFEWGSSVTKGAPAYERVRNNQVEALRCSPMCYMCPSCWRS